MAKQDGGGDVVLDNRLLKQDLRVFCFELKGKLLSIGPPKKRLAPMPEDRTDGDGL